MKLPPFRKYLVQYIGGSIALIAALYFAFTAIDGAGLSEQVSETAVVEAKANRPASHGTRVVKSGNTYHTTSTYIPEAWLVTVGIDGESGIVNVPRSDYDHFAIGETVQAVHSRKRITRSLVIRALFKKD